MPVQNRFSNIAEEQYNQYKKNFNYKINAILEVIQKKYPNITSHKDWLKGVDITKITNYADIPDDWK